jgi:diguanylate cyclase (GGDEF)-like protein
MGNPPDEPHDLRIVRVEIEARSGPPLGTLYAGIEPTIPPEERENVALNNGSRLATLAIETLRLYSDLHRRSEIDTLTGILNRFSMHSRIDASIESAYQIARIFGLIYIDLDNFKPINDLYGHHVGDLYLQEVAARMKRQLRGGDVLARLGGDEFAALVAVVRNRSEIEHIVFRLDRCFEDAFVVEGHVLRGSASVGIALYPEDGTTRDELLNASDAAMYAAKSAKREAQEGCEPVEEELDGSPS